MSYRGGRGGRQSSSQKAKELGNEKHIDLVNRRLAIIQDQIDEFITIQRDLPPTLLTFKGLDFSAKDQTNDEDQEQVQLEELKNNALKVEQQVNLIRSVAAKVEKELHFNDSTEFSAEQKQELRIKKLQEEEDLYKNLQFNMDYQLRQEGRSFHRSQHSTQEMLFELGNLNEKNYLTIYQHSTYDSTKRQLNEDKAHRLCSLHIQFPDFQNEAEYFKFDDFMNSVFIDWGHTFKQITLTLPFQNNLSLLSALRFLLTVNSCNILHVALSYSRLDEQPEKVKELLETLYYVIFNIKNLQALTLQLKHTQIAYLVNALRRIDPTKLNLRTFGLKGDQRLANSNDISELFNFFSRVPGLYDFEADQIILSGVEIEKNFASLLKIISQINIKLHQVPRTFNWDLPLENLISLKLIVSFEPNQMNNKLLERFLISVKKAQNLSIFAVTFGIEASNQTSRKNILRDAQSKKEEEEESAAAAATDTLEETTEVPTGPVIYYDHLSELPKLKMFSLTSPTSQKVFDSLLKLLQKNTNIQKFTVRASSLNQTNKDASKKDDLDFKNIYEILNGLPAIQSVQINADSNELNYSLPNKLSTLYTVNQRISTRGINSVFNPDVFKFDKVNNITIQQYTIDLSTLDSLCQSLSNSRNITSIKLVSQTLTGIYKIIQRNPASQPKLAFFKHLGKLNKLQHLKINTPFDQHILDSLQSLVADSTTLKSLVVKRETLNQYYLNYAGLFNSIQNSKSLEQLYLQTNIERIEAPSSANAQKWNDLKLANYYHPAAKLFTNVPQQLSIIDLDEVKAHAEGSKALLESINSAPHMVYTKFHGDLLREIKASGDEGLITALNTVIQSGRIVSPQYKLPLAQVTFQQYSYW